MNKQAIKNPDALRVSVHSEIRKSSVTAIFRLRSQASRTLVYIEGSIFGKILYILEIRPLFHGFTFNMSCKKDI